MRGTSELAVAIARRLVSQANPDIDQAAKRLVAAAPMQGIDLKLTWIAVDEVTPGSVRVRQACLAVPGSGRTAMLFLSEPPRAGEIGDDQQAALCERVAVVRAACEDLRKERARQVVLAQSLPSPDETWSVIACLEAGFTRVGTLHYLRRPAEPVRTRDAKTAPTWPAGVEVVSVASLPTSRREDVLLRVMDASYADTLDCPELCGLRATRDILASHQATGQFDPALWWIGFAGEEPIACAFMSAWPEQRSCELVYLGIVPAWRGKGLGRTLLEHAMRAASLARGALSFTCAVDERNTPALRLYDAMGYRAFAKRVALVKPLLASDLASAPPTTA